MCCITTETKMSAYTLLQRSFWIRRRSKDRGSRGCLIFTSGSRRCEAPIIVPTTLLSLCRKRALDVSCRSIPYRVSRVDVGDSFRAPTLPLRLPNICPIATTTTSLKEKCEFASKQTVDRQEISLARSLNYYLWSLTLLLFLPHFSSNSYELLLSNFTNS